MEISESQIPQEGNKWCCSICGEELRLGLNWWASVKAEHCYWCKNCMNKKNRDWQATVKKRAFERISGKAECSVPRCGCDDIRLLELNMKGGGHGKLFRQGKLNTGVLLYNDILQGRVDPEQFEVMCRPHNAAEYLERKYGVKFDIKFIK